MREKGIASLFQICLEKFIDQIYRYNGVSSGFQNVKPLIFDSYCEILNGNWED